MASVSIVYQDKRINMLYRPGVFRELIDYIERQLPFMQINRITYRDEDGDIISLKNDEDLQAAYMFCDSNRCGLELYLECSPITKSFMSDSLFQQYNQMQPFQPPIIPFNRQSQTDYEQPPTGPSPYAPSPRYINSPPFSTCKDLEILSPKDQPVSMLSTQMPPSGTEQQVLDAKPATLPEASPAPKAAMSENSAVCEPVSKIEIPCMVNCFKCNGKGRKKNMKECMKC